MIHPRERQTTQFSIPFCNDAAQRYPFMNPRIPYGRLSFPREAIEVFMDEVCYFVGCFR